MARANVAESIQHAFIGKNMISCYEIFEDRLVHGNPGKHRVLTNGVCELKIDYGPGYRVYYTELGGELIVLLAVRGQSASRVMGDRISEKKLSIQDGKIILDYIRTGPKDPMCCPTERAVTTLQYGNGELLVVNDQVIANP